MVSKFGMAALVVCMVCGLQLAVDAAPRVYPPAASCPNALDGSCAPKRATYGYVPTTWRRWPTNGDPEVPKRNPEQVPTPAAVPSKKPAVKTEPEFEGPIVTPEEETLPPPGNAPSMQSPNLEDAPVFDDTPPTPPAEAPAATPDASDAIVPGDDVPTPPGDSDAAMPEDEDPFKDEPIDTEGTSGSRGPSKLRLDPASGESSTVRWKVNKDPALARAGGKRGEEPRRLQAVDGRGSAPINSAERPTNPLRSAEDATTQRVVPTANWSKSAPQANEAAGTWRRNPLRASN